MCCVCGASRARECCAWSVAFFITFAWLLRLNIDSYISAGLCAHRPSSPSGSAPLPHAICIYKLEHGGARSASHIPNKYTYSSRASAAPRPIWRRVRHTSRVARWFSRFASWLSALRFMHNERAVWLFERANIYT